MATKVIDKENEDLSFSTRNKLVTAVCPILTRDSKFIICASESDILVFHRKTGVKEHTFRGHKENVCFLQLDSQDPLQVVSCSKSRLHRWDYTDLNISKSIKFNITIEHLALNTKDSDIIYYSRKRKNKKDKQNDKKLALCKNSLSSFDNETELGHVLNSSKTISVSADGNYIAYINKKELIIYSEKENSKKTYKNEKSNFTCVSFHPTKRLIGAGDVKGNISIWFDFKNIGKTPPIEFHWHPTPVRDMVFTVDGNYLLSGGDESVLVVWHLGNREKSFIPRLGGAITHLFSSIDGKYVGITLKSNVIKILSTVDYQLSKSIKLLAKGCSTNNDLQYHPKLESIVLNSSYQPGVLQFYHPRQDSLKLSLDIIGENYVPVLEERVVYPTNIKKIACSEDGHWMATIDHRKDPILPVELKLKIWEFNDDSKKFSISAIVDPPHDDDDVVALRFRPNTNLSDYDYMLFTASKDGSIKSWITTEQESLIKREMKTIRSWQMNSMVKYVKGDLKEALCTSDGTVLAALFSDVTLWDTETLSFQTSLSCHSIGEEIKGITIAQKESSHYLLGYTENLMIVWNLSTLQAQWKLQINVISIISDPYSKYVAIFLKQEIEIKPIKSYRKSKPKKVIFLDPSSPEPFGVYPIKGHNIKNAIFIPDINVEEKYTPLFLLRRLYILNRAGELMSLESKEEKVTDNKKNVEKDDYSVGFKDLFGSYKVPTKDHQKDDDETPIGNPTSNFIRQLKSTPANVLPSADIICRDLLKTLLVRKSTNNGNEEKDENEESDEDMEKEIKKGDFSDNGTAEEKIKDKKPSNTENNDIVGEEKKKSKCKIKLKHFDFDFTLEPFG